MKRKMRLHRTRRKRQENTRVVVEATRDKAVKQISSQVTRTVLRHSQEVVKRKKGGRKSGSREPEQSFASEGRSQKTKTT